MPWAKFEDGELLGWSTSWRMWKSYFLPYRTAEWLGLGDDGELLLGPWQWHRPNAFRAQATASDGNTPASPEPKATPKSSGSGSRSKKGLT